MNTATALDPARERIRTYRDVYARVSVRAGFSTALKKKLSLDKDEVLSYFE